jgi:transposase
VLGAFAGSRYFLYRHPTDMRKGFTGLSGLVINEMGFDHLSGDAYIFLNKRRTLVKILIWDRTGFVIYYKKLACGTFELPQWKDEKNNKELSVALLMMILEGVKVSTAQMRKRYIPAKEKRA